MKKLFIPILLFFSILVLILLSSTDTTLSCEGCVPLSKDDYTLKTSNINKDNKWSAFRDEGHGIFFIHPGGKNVSIGEFTFKNNANFFLTFSIRAGSKWGNIKFSIKKNSREIANFIITKDQTNQLLLTVNKKDTLSITADKHGSAGYDWGNLKIENQPNLVQYKLSKVYSNIIIYKKNIIIILLLSIIILLYIKFKNHHLLQKFEESSLFLKIFQIILFIWIFSIPLKNSIYQISTILLITFFFIHLLYYKQKDSLLEVFTTYKKLLIVFLLFIAAMTFSSLLGISEQGTIKEIFKYSLRYLVILIILFYFYKQTFFSKKWLLTVIFIVLCINSLDGVYQYMTGYDFILDKSPDKPSYLLTGAVYHHNPFGLFMTIGAIMSLTLFFDKNIHTIFKYDKVIYFASLLTFLFTLFHSQSRAAWVMFGIYFIAYMSLYIKKNGINKKLFATLISLLIVSVILFLSDDNLLHRLTLLLQGNSAGRATLIWPFTIDKIVDSPIFGYGIDTYKLLASSGSISKHAGVHNLSLELLLYTGIVGFSILYYLVWISLKESFTTDKIIYSVLLFSYIVLLQFDGSLIDSKVHLNIFIIMLFFIYSVRSDNTKSS